ncbi:MAG: hypothetical protein Q8P49_04100 [Candidatus Liptonbacteria bacterium]|nr:hypothetical protein [Candidatus Liptonbacteria bacterium]
MLTIWRNFFIGRKWLPLNGILALGFLNAVTALPKAPRVLWPFLIALAIFGYLFALPAIVYLIDMRNKGSDTAH